MDDYGYLWLFIPTTVMVMDGWRIMGWWWMPVVLGRTNGEG